MTTQLRIDGGEDVVTDVVQDYREAAWADALRELREENARLHRALCVVTDERDQLMRLPNNRLEGYRELGDKCASMEKERDTALGAAEIAVRQCAQMQRERNDWYQMAEAYRSAIEWSLGLGADPVNHTPAWVRETVRVVREIGNDADNENADLRTERDQARAVVAKLIAASWRQGWEEGPSESDVHELACDCLANWDLDPVNNRKAFEEAVRK